MNPSLLTRWSLFVYGLLKLLRLQPGTDGEPQRPQKYRCTVLPLSVSLSSYNAGVPRRENSALGTPASVEKAEPAWRWQFLQWQIACITGSAVIS